MRTLIPYNIKQFSFLIFEVMITSLSKQEYEMVKEPLSINKAIFSWDPKKKEQFKAFFCKEPNGIMAFSYSTSCKLELEDACNMYKFQIEEVN